MTDTERIRELEETLLDMHAALEPLVPFMEAYRVGEGSTERDYEFFEPFIQKARAALAKARGAA